MNEPAPRGAQECPACGRRISAKSANHVDETGCLFCKDVVDDE